MNLFDTYTIFSTGKSLKDAEIVTIKSDDDILYIHQTEMAAVRYGIDAISTEFGGWIDPSLPRYVGTSEMTSCHALLITSSIGYVFGHLDGSCEGRLTRDFFEVAQKFFDTYLISDEIPEVHIVGGFLDSNGYSKDLSLQIITQLLISRRTFRLQTLCCYTLNDHLIVESGQRVHMPTIRAVVFDIHTGILSPASIPLGASGPLNVLRSSYTYSISARNHMNNIMHPTSHHLILRPFTIDDNTLRALASLRNLPNKQLQRFSTTPEQETDQFYEKLRLTGHLLTNLKESGVNLFAQGNLEFFYGNVNHWHPANVQTREAVRYLLTCLT